MSQYLPALELSSLDGNNGFRINGEALNDWSGSAVSSAGDINGDGFADLIIGSPSASPHGLGSGAAYVVFGSQSGFAAEFELSELHGDNGFRVKGQNEGNNTGSSVASAGDVNGDGFDDAIMSRAPYYGSAAVAYVVFGKADGFRGNLEPDTLDGSNGFQIIGSSGGGRDVSVAGAGDVNGDGIADLIVGTPNSFPDRKGDTYVVFGKSSGFDAAFELSSIDGNNGFQVVGQTKFDRAGISVAAAGDVNGDGLADLIVGADLASAHDSQHGAAYVVFGRSDGFDSTSALVDLDGSNGFKIKGEATADRLGLSVASAGDINGDGLADVIVGAHFADPNGDGSGVSYVVFGTESGFDERIKLAKLDGRTGFQINGVASFDVTGSSVASAGDFNGDGFSDLIVGAEAADPNGESSGASYLVFGKASGFGAEFELTSLDGNNGFQIRGEGAGDSAGYSVASAGDVNGDGFADIVVGAPTANPNGENSGASYVIFGGKPSEAVVRIGTIIANTIHGGDLEDVLAGRSGDDLLTAHNGSDVVRAGNGSDALFGGDGDDALNGSEGADALDGGRGADRFIYRMAAASTSTAHDTIINADFTVDSWDVPMLVRKVGQHIDTGALSSASFDADLAAAADAAHLKKHNAVLFAADAGDLAGATFLVVDQNGVAGYQANVDMVFRLVGAVNLANLDVSDFI